MELKKAHLVLAIKRKVKEGECAGFEMGGKAKENYRVSYWGRRAPLPRGGANIVEDIVWHEMTEDE